MKQKTFAFLLIIMILAPCVCHAAPELDAPAAILIDADSGLVLYEKNSAARVFPASTTKIMTAILAIENGDMSAILTANFEAVNSIAFDSSKVDLTPGEQMSYKDLVYSLIIASANDAANVLAEHISGNTTDFVALMNEKAQQLGAYDTHFENAHGLHNENHYTTAADMAKIARYAMTLPVFADAVSTKTYSIAPTNKTQTPRTLTSTNQLLNSKSQYYYKYATGIKTGYTSNAGYCLVSSAKDSGTTLIAAVFGDKPNDEQTLSFVDSKKLLRYGLGELKRETIAEKGSIISDVPIKSSYSDNAILEAVSPVSAVLPEGVSPDMLEKREYITGNTKAPIKKGEILGKAEYLWGDTVVAQTELASVADYKKIPLAFIFKPIYVMFKSASFYIVLAVLFIIFLLLRYIRVQRIKRIRRRRRRQK